MRVFVTGASGWIGSAVVPELIGAGHQVVGLARSDASADALTAAGAEVHRGTLDDLDILRSGGRRLRRRDPPRVQARPRVLAETSRAPPTRIAAPSRHSARRSRALIGRSLIASGLLGLAPGHVATEQDGHGPRRGRRPPSAAVRRPAGKPPSSRSPSPPGASAPRSCGFLRRTTATATTASWRPWSASPARRASPATSATAPTAGPPCIGSIRRACSVSRLEQAPAGSTLHAVAEEGVPFRDIAEVIGRHLDIPVVSVAPEDAGEHFAWLAGFVALDARPPAR